MQDKNKTDCGRPSNHILCYQPWLNVECIKSIKVILVGAVKKQGTFTLSSLATLFNALFISGGPAENGSYRNIELIRNNKIIQVTNGNWQINKICGYNPTTSTVYYTSTEFSTIQDNLWKVSITSKKRSMFASGLGNTSVIMSSNAAWYYLIQSNFHLH